MLHFLGVSVFTLVDLDDNVDFAQITHLVTRLDEALGENSLVVDTLGHGPDDVILDEGEELGLVRHKLVLHLSVHASLRLQFEDVEDWGLLATRIVLLQLVLGLQGLLSDLGC